MRVKILLFPKHYYFAMGPSQTQTSFARKIAAGDESMWCQCCHLPVWFEVSLEKIRDGHFLNIDPTDLYDRYHNRRSDGNLRIEFYSDDNEVVLEVADVRYITDRDKEIRVTKYFNAPEPAECWCMKGDRCENNKGT